MTRQESVVYNGYEIGGTSDATAQLLDRFGIGEDEAGAYFACNFLVNQGSSSSLETACQTMLEALRTQNKKLVVTFSGSNVRTFDPDVSANTSTTSGFNQHPTVRKLDGAYSVFNTATTRAFGFRVNLDLPPNYSGALGRREAFANLHYDVTDRLVVQIRGAYTQIPTKVARTAFTDAINAFCTTRLALISPGALWVITRRDPEEDDNFQNVLTFNREFSQVVAGGRRGSRLDIDFKPSGQRFLMLTGTYLRTDATFGGGAAAASVNVVNGSTGAVVYGTAALAALTAGEGGALTVGTDAELVHKKFTPNEQDDRCDFLLVYREILFKQSSAASGLDDPDVLLDSVTFSVSPTPSDDSPIPAVTSSVAAPGTAAGSAPSNPFTGTIEKRGPPNAANAGVTSGAANVSPARRPVVIGIRYRAIFAKTVTSMKTKWEGTILPYLMGAWADQVGFSAMELIKYEPAYDPTSMSIEAIVLARAYVGSCVSFSASEAVSEDLGIRLSAAFAGVPHAYLVQQGLPKLTRRRTLSATYRTGSAFSLDKFQSQSQVPGWVVVARHKPEKKERVLGVPSLGVPQISLTNDQLIEDLVYVAVAVAGSTGGIPGGGAQGSDNGGGQAQNGQGGGPAATQSANSPGANPASDGTKLPPAPAKFHQSIFQKGGYVF